MLQSHDIAPVRFLALRGFATHQLAYTLDSLVRVSRRADEAPSASIARTQFPKNSKSDLHYLGRSDGRDTASTTRRRGPTHATHADQRPVLPANRQGTRQPGRTRGDTSLPSQQFQVLFNSLFKVLFIFPSRYLFAIGLPSVFSLRWDLPPPLGCIPKQPDSTTTAREVSHDRPHGVLTLSDAPFQGTWGHRDTEHASIDYNSPFEERRFSRWAFPGSLAVTRGILVSFFSSAY